MLKRPISALLLVLMIAGCSKEVTGQTVAMVNDEEISLSELNAELNRANLPANADKKAVMAQLLQQIIDRKLLAQAAVKDGIDRSPEFLTEERRMREELLMKLTSERQLDTIKLPSKAEIDKFIAANPSMFEQRAIVALDQLQFDPPSDPAVMNEIKDDHSLAEIGETLSGRGIQFTKSQARLDLGTVAPAIANQITNLPAGEPFVVPSGGKLVASVITARQPVTATPEVLRSAAATTIRRQKLLELLQTRLKDAKGRAEIKYQPEYEPKPPSKATQAAKTSTKG